MIHIMSKYKKDVNLEWNRESLLLLPYFLGEISIKIMKFHDFCI